MKNKIDKSLQEVWDMKAAAHERYIISGYQNYAEYLKFRQKDIDDYINQIIYEKMNDVTY